MKMSTYISALFFTIMSLDAFAAPGEYWEITSKMDIPGMPYAMPAQKAKVCLAKGGQGDPHQTQKNCTFSDIQKSGNTLRFKGTCTNDQGDRMDMTGELTHDANSFKTKMKMTTEGHGKSGAMIMSSSGRRIGGSCDADAIAKKAQAQADQSRKDVNKIVADACASGTKNDPRTLLEDAGHYVGKKPMCSNKKEYCQTVRTTFQHDVKSYEMLVERDGQYKSDKRTANMAISSICGLDLAGMKKVVCKNSVHSGPQDFMDKNCSAAQAKEYREYERKQACGRDYTAPEDRKACLKGEMPARSYTSDEAGKPESSKNADKAKSGALQEGAQKLKGLLHF